MHFDYKTTLKHLTNSLLQPDATYTQMFDATEQLYRLFVDAASMQVDNLQNRADLFLPQGKAIAPIWAAMCVKDFYRTRQLLRGMILGIQSARQLFPGAPVHVVYAGTGPFGALALPLTTIFSPDEVQFTLIEINPVSIQMLRKVIATCRAEAHIREIVQADATTYQVSSAVHMVVTETMQQALQDEPQVAITQNLAAQLVKDGILIPQRVTVHAGLFNCAKMFELNVPDSIRRLLLKIFDLSDTTLQADFPEVIVDIPQDFETGFSQFCLFTDIHVFGDVHLQIGESGLTQPKVLLQTGKDGKFGVQKIGLQYVQHTKPGFQIRIIGKDI